MNDDKTELMAIGTRSKLRQVIPNLAPMSISSCDVPFSQSVPLGRCTLVTPLCWQFLASPLRPLGKDLSLFLDPLSGTHYHYPSEKHSVLQLLKQNLRLIFFTFICAEVQVLVSVCITQVCVCVCVCVIISLYVYIDTVFGFYGIFFPLFSWMFQHDCLDICCFECLICMCFVFLYLHPFSAIEHFSHGNAH